MRFLRRIRRANYRTARMLGDVSALSRPRRIPARMANKVIGRHVVRRLWR
jgi:hypothetical protein